MNGITQSVHQKLLNIRDKTGEQFNHLLIRYGLERFLYRLVASGHDGDFVLKGAMLFALWRNVPGRPTRDVDLLGFGELDHERLKQVFTDACMAEVVDDGLRFDPKSIVTDDIRDDQEYHGVRVRLIGYLGNTIINKTMANVDIEYEVTVDTLGRITGETFSDISTTQSFITNSYGYTNHTYRLDERNTIDYGFDTLGRVTSEDSTSYTCDILGNPTNASDDGLTYGLDNEDRIVDVDDGSGIFAEYEYDRLGRRSKKTVDSVDMNFVYDIFGNIIAEYEDGNWSRDYVYGATGEAVYMRFPQTTAMNDGLENFVSFIDAWLCYPDCTTEQLVWDANDDSQVNLIDWAAAADANDFAGAFMTNGRYLLTDFRNSVIGKVNLDGSVDEIFYNAWGTPYVAQGTDLERLSVFWNSYYLDGETGNYYLRNRYYSPLERRFLTEDPHGVNPDGNWNNPFEIRWQYIDGYGLQVYAQGDPVNNIDPWGLWKYAVPVAQRTKEAKTFVEASGVWEMKYNIKGLAQLVRLNEEEFDKWGQRSIHKVNGIKKCGAWVPNTAYLDVGSYSWGFLRVWLLGFKSGLNSLWESKGLHVVYSNGVSAQDVLSHLQSDDIYSYAYLGHGAVGTLVVVGEKADEDDISIDDLVQPGRYVQYQIPEMQLIACETEDGRSRWEENVTPGGWLRTIKGTLKSYRQKIINE